MRPAHRHHRPFAILSAAASCLAPALLHAAETAEEWPREIQVPEADIVVYQPQIEEFAGDVLTARSAVAVTPAGASEPVFGTVWFAAHLNVDRDARLVTLVSLAVTDARFPNARQENLDKLAALLKKELSARAHPVSLDRFVAALSAAEASLEVDDRLNTTPPRILFASVPTVLVTIDGQPELRPIENSRFQRVANTPYLIVSDPASGVLHLRGGDTWYAAGRLQGPWKPVADPPADVASLLQQEPTTAPAPDNAAPAGPPPAVIVATEPTELVVSDGPPRFDPLKGTSIQYMSNTDADVFREPASKACYVLLAGRWFTAPSLDGPWSYVAANRLPPDFARIPEDSEKADVLAHVAGTPAALDAVHDASIPQTAQINRNSATPDVQYDGQPRFETIRGTDMQYAVNSPFDIIRVGHKYYCCHEAVWFVADSPSGPWTVCDAVPAVVYTIPPESPVYPVTYVSVYESAPETVCVGYTGGYVGCYPYAGAVVYGTGYWYTGWCGTAYWARPATWGFGARYNSVTGYWGFHAGYAGPNGWIAFGYRDGRFYQGPWIAGGWHGHCGGWFGHGGYHDFNLDRNVNINNINIANRAGQRVNIGDRNNIYQRIGNRDRIRPAPADRPALADRPRPAQMSPDRRPGAAPTSPAISLQNNVFADRQGNIFRRTDSGTWEQRVGNQWQKPDFAAPGARDARGPVIRPQSPLDRPAPGRQAIRPGQPAAIAPRPAGAVAPGPAGTVAPGPAIAPAPRPASPVAPRAAIERLPASSPQADINRQYQARQRGDYRSSNFQQYRSSGGARPGHIGGGGFRGGGRGGRR